MEDDTGSIMNISMVNNTQKAALDKSIVYKLEEERIVECINNEIKVWGKRNLDSACQKLFLNTSFDLIVQAKLKEFPSIQQPAHCVAPLRQEQLQKM